MITEKENFMEKPDGAKIKTAALATHVGEKLSISKPAWKSSGAFVKSPIFLNLFSNQ